MKTLLQRLSRSLTARLLLLFIVVSLCLEILLVVTLLHGFSSQWRGNIRPHLEQYLDYVNADIGNPPSIAKAQEIAKRLPINIYIYGPETNFASNGDALDLNDIEFRDKRHDRYTDRKHQADYRKSNSTTRSGAMGSLKFGEHRDRTILLNTIGDHKIYYELQHAGRRQHRNGFVLLALVCLVGILAACYLLLRRMLSPVQDIKTGVSLMGQGQLDYRVPVRADNDLGELAGSINTMASDIEQMLDAKRQLLLGASHELRSPLTRARVATQLLDESANRTRIEEDLAEMEMLIRDILESERMKAGHAVLDRRLIKLDELVASVLVELQAEDVMLHYDPTLDRVSADETRIHLLLRNLLSNAVNYSVGAAKPPQIKISRNSLDGLAGAAKRSLQPPPANADAVFDVKPSTLESAFSRIRTRDGVSQKDELLLITISDSGPGIAAAYLPKITEPFYRPDASRTRKTGGFGLGLHLARLIAEAHGGVMAIESIASERPPTAIQTDETGSAKDEAEGQHGDHAPQHSGETQITTGTVVTVAIPLLSS